MDWPRQDAEDGNETAQTRHRSWSSLDSGFDTAAANTEVDEEDEESQQQPDKRHGGPQQHRLHTRIHVYFLTVSDNSNNNNNNNQDNVYGAVIMTQSHCESSRGSRDECRTAPDGCRLLDHHRHLLILSPRADTHFTIPQRVEAESTKLAGYIPRRFTCPQAVTHPNSITGPSVD